MSAAFASLTRLTTSRLAAPRLGRAAPFTHAFRRVSRPALSRAMSASASGEKIVLLTGSTGRVGKEVIARLSKVPGFRVRAATRDKAEYATSLGAHETVVFDLEDPKTWGPAMDGVTHLFSSTQDKYIAQHMAFAKWCGETPSIKTTLEHIVRIRASARTPIRTRTTRTCTSRAPARASR